MPVVRVLWQRVYVAIATLSWSVLGLALVTHALVSWLLLAWAGEGDLTGDPVTFAYYYMTTATTVGYGDLSPGGQAGRLVDIVWVLPGSIALFTSVLGKAISDISGFWRKRLQGMGDFSQRRGHTLVVGWQGTRTRHLIEGLVHEHQDGESVVLLASAVSENPLPDTVDFVHTEELSYVESYERAGAAGANAVIVRGNHDDETLAATLAARAAAPAAHIVAYFQDDSAAMLVRRQFPEIEVITSIASDMLVRAARDPGSSRLADLMFSGRSADTAFSMTVPAGTGAMRYLPLLLALKQRHDLTLIGVARQGGGAVDLNCPPDCEIAGGDTIYYIADARCAPETVAWAPLREVTA